MTPHVEVLTARQLGLLKRIGAQVSGLGFYLGGGTALALHLGHQRSVDLDWFTSEPFPDAMRIARIVGDTGASLAARQVGPGTLHALPGLRALLGRVELAARQVGPGTLHGTASGVRVSFLEYRYPLRAPPVVWPGCGCRLASLEDIARMKLSAVAQRGSKRDFVDIYALAADRIPLPRMLDLYRRKHGIADIAHVMYGLL